MAATFIELDSLEKLDKLIKDSHDRPVIVFKHSNSCGISSGVYSEVRSIEAEVNVVVVQTHRGLSNEIEKRTGIRHQSPQAIVLSGGEPIYHASHYDVDIENIASLLSV
jgi:bacillithiol system protein YtxJ